MRRRNFIALVAVFLIAATLHAVASPEPPWSAATNCSGTITVASTTQQLFSSGVHHGFEIQNLSNGLMGFSEFTSTVVLNTAGVRTLYTSSPGNFYRTPATYGSGSAVSIVGTHLGDAFTCAVW